jgi:hypothetical protein
MTQDPRATRLLLNGRQIYSARDRAGRKWRLAIGPDRDNPITTCDFQCDDEAVDAELAALSSEELCGRLLAACGVTQGPIREIGRGYWGDVKTTLKSLRTTVPAPARCDWVRMGWPGEDLQELFPDWNKTDTDPVLGASDAGSAP